MRKDTKKKKRIFLELELFYFIFFENQLEIYCHENIECLSVLIYIRILYMGCLCVKHEELDQSSNGTMTRIVQCIDTLNNT